MKTKLVVIKETPQIDWSKTNLLTDGNGMYIMNVREGAKDDEFAAVVLHDEEGRLKVGSFCGDFTKKYWGLVTDEITLTFNAK